MVSASDVYWPTLPVLSMVRMVVPDEQVTSAHTASLRSWLVMSWYETTGKPAVVSASDVDQPTSPAMSMVRMVVPDEQVASAQTASFRSPASLSRYEMTGKPAGVSASDVYAPTLFPESMVRMVAPEKHVASAHTATLRSCWLSRSRR